MLMWSGKPSGVYKKQTRIAKYTVNSDSGLKKALGLFQVGAPSLFSKFRNGWIELIN